METGGAQTMGEIKLTREKREADTSSLYQSPVGLLILVAGAIFLTEALVMFLLRLFPQLPPFAEALLDASILILILSPLLYVSWYRPFRLQLTERQRSEGEVRALTRELIQAAEEERRRLSRDIHDEFGQAITGLQLGTESLLAALPSVDEPIGTRGSALQQKIQSLGETVRNFASVLRPEILDDLGVVPALQWHIRQLAREGSGLRIDFRTAGLPTRLPAQIEITTYRICQEALSNIQRHSGATEATIQLTRSHPLILLTIRDNGRGFQPQVAGGRRRGLGLMCMRERVNASGGTIEIASHPGQGTAIRVELPLEEGVGDG